MALTRRDQSKEKLWKYRLKRWRESGLTVPQYCVQEMLNEHNFRSWQATIKKRDEETEWRQEILDGNSKVSGPSSKSAWESNQLHNEKLASVASIC